MRELHALRAVTAHCCARLPRIAVCGYHALRAVTVHSERVTARTRGNRMHCEWLPCIAVRSYRALRAVIARGNRAHCARLPRIAAHGYRMHCARLPRNARGYRSTRAVTTRMGVIN